MGVYLYAGTAKRLTIIDREGREVTAGIATIVCKSGDEDPHRWHGDARWERTARLYAARLSAAAERHGGANAPEVWVQTSLTEGAGVILAKRSGTYDDATSEYVPGHLRAVTDRAGKKVWVVFPEPKCSTCFDSGVALRSGGRALNGGGVMRWRMGDECPCCGSPEATMLAIANGRRADENLARITAEQAEAARRSAEEAALRKAQEAAAAAKAKLEAARREYEAALNAVANVEVRA